jgi:hypothetical protein
MVNIDRQLRQQREHYHRTKNVRWKFFSLRVTPDDFEELRMVAARNGTSVSELIRTFIVWGLDAED